MRHPLMVAAAAFALLAGCTTPEQRAAQAEQDYGELCRNKGYEARSEQWRACVETEAMNAALAAQRDHEREFLRRHDCIDPKLGCSPTR
jgi:hypothetical protein